MTSRRQLIACIPLLGLAAWQVRAAGAPMVDEKDPTAVGLGYVADATKADKAKYKQYAAGQACANCQLYQGTAGAAAGACAIYGGKQVSAKGWCSAYVKKA